MKNFRSLLIALCALALIACGDDTVDLGPGDPDSGVEDDASTQLPPDEEEDEDDEGRGDDPGDGDDGPGDDPGDGDDGPGDDPGDDPGDGDDGPGDGAGDGDGGGDGDGDGEDPGTEDPVILNVRVILQSLEPASDAVVSVLGAALDPATTDETGSAQFEVPETGHYVVRVEPPSGDWAFAMAVLVEKTPNQTQSLVVPDVSFGDTLGQAIGLTLSEDKAAAIFSFIGVVPGGQSVTLTSGESFIQLPPEPPATEGVAVSGSTLVEDGGNVVIYAELAPGSLTPIYASANAGEECDSEIEPYGGWIVPARTLLFVDVACSVEGGD